MKQSLPLDEFLHFISDQGIQVNQEQMYQLERYLNSLLHWTAKHNLISKHDSGYVVERHILPSAFIIKLITHHSKVRVLDVGSGAGFPGVVLAILCPCLEMTLIDSARKKCLFLKEVCQNIHLDVAVHQTRIEKWHQKNNTTFDYIVSRAVSSAERLWNWTHQRLNTSGQLIVIKGGEVSDEIAAIDPENTRLRIEKPDINWIRMAPDLAHKKYLIMERKNV